MTHDMMIPCNLLYSILPQVWLLHGAGLRQWEGWCRQTPSFLLLVYGYLGLELFWDLAVSRTHLSEEGRNSLLPRNCRSRSTSRLVMIGGAITINAKKKTPPFNKGFTSHLSSSFVLHNNHIPCHPSLSLLATIKKKRECVSSKLFFQDITSIKPVFLNLVSLNLDFCRCKYY